MPSESRTPSDITIEPRNRQHDISDSLSRDWLDHHAFKTAWMNAMSITFPLGEKFFIDSVRHFADQVADSKLKDEIRGFCGQEGFHRREHERYNKALCASRDYNLVYLEGRLEKNIALACKWLSPIERLAMTAALEHITAIMAEQMLLDSSHLLARAEQPMRELWSWHAAEEMEHKSVAFDVYKAVGGSERMRKTALRRASFFLTVDVLIGTVHMLRRDGKLWNLRLWRDGWGFLFAKDGILRLMWPAYKEYFRDNFHPWQQDTRYLLESWKVAQA